MGSFLGGGSAKKAAKQQARNIEYQTKMNVLSANLQAESMTQQIAQAQAQKAATDYAEKLLATPVEQAQVNLVPQDEVAQSGDLLERRRTVRSTYRAPARTARSRAGINVQRPMQ